MEWTETFSPPCISNLYLAQQWIDQELAGAGAPVSWEFVVVVRRPASQVVLIWYSFFCTSHNSCIFLTFLHCISQVVLIWYRANVSCPLL